MTKIIYLKRFAASHGTKQFLSQEKIHEAQVISNTNILFFNFIMNKKTILQF